MSKMPSPPLENFMDQAGRDLQVAFAMGTIGAPPIGESEPETTSGQSGLNAMESVARYERAVRALIAISDDHPELNIRATIEEVVAGIRSGGNVSDALARIDDLLSVAKPYLPE